MPAITLNNRSVYFIHIPKTSGTSLYSNLLHQGATVENWNKIFSPVDSINVPFQHMHMSILQERYKDFDLLESFSIIRNPKKRLLSEYLYTRNRVTDLSKFDDWFTKVMTVYKVKPNFLENHLRPQVEFINEHVKLFLMEDQSSIYKYISKCLDKTIKHGIIKNAQQTPIIADEYDIKDLLSKNNYQLFTNVYSQDISLYKRLTDC